MLEKGIVVGVNVNSQIYFEEEMVELKNLCEACNIEVVDELTQNAKSVNSLTYVGSGKIEELAELVQQKEATVVVFLQELTPSQIKHLDEALQIEILDRTSLILEIFANRAKTREAKLQVEMVRLQYELPRLVGRNSNLSRQAGGSGATGGGTSAGGRNKGAGETKLELNRRQIEEHISILKKELDQIQIQRTTQRYRRKKNGLPMVALVGYTNAGKSTIMNQLVRRYIKDEQKQVLEKDMLFATLETSVRKIRLESKEEFLLSDTVGFVSNLPHNLIKAFQSTLEEACEADLLLHVVDRSNPDYQTQIEVTKQTLKEIGADHIPVLYVYNKMDLVENAESMNMEVSSDFVRISAKMGTGMEELIRKIQKQVLPEREKVKVRIPYKEGAMIAKVRANATILLENCLPESMEYELECNSVIKQALYDYII